MDLVLRRMKLQAEDRAYYLHELVYKWCMVLCSVYKILFKEMKSKKIESVCITKKKLGIFIKIYLYNRMLWLVLTWSCLYIPFCGLLLVAMRFIHVGWISITISNLIGLDHRLDESFCFIKSLADVNDYMYFQWLMIFS